MVGETEQSLKKKGRRLYRGARDRGRAYRLGCHDVQCHRESFYGRLFQFANPRITLQNRHPKRLGAQFNFA